MVHRFVTDILCRNGQFLQLGRSKFKKLSLGEGREFSQEKERTQHELQLIQTYQTYHTSDSIFSATGALLLYYPFDHYRSLNSDHLLDVYWLLDFHLYDFFHKDRFFNLHNLVDIDQLLHLYDYFPLNWHLDLDLPDYLDRFLDQNDLLDYDWYLFHLALFHSSQIVFDAIQILTQSLKLPFPRVLSCCPGLPVHHLADLFNMLPVDIHKLSEVTKLTLILEGLGLGRMIQGVVFEAGKVVYFMALAEWACTHGIQSFELTLCWRAFKREINLRGHQDEVDNFYFYILSDKVIDLIANLLLQSTSMIHQDQEIVGLDDEDDTLLSSKMKDIKHVRVSSNCLSSLSLGSSRNNSPPSCQSLDNKVGGPSAKIIMSPSKPLKASIFAPVSRTKRSCSPSSLRSCSKQQQVKQKGPSPKLFEIRKECKGRRKNHLREVPIVQIHDFTGYGLLILPTLKKFEGEWIGGSLVGKAKVIYPNGDVYQGETYDYRRHGRGELLFPQGRYVGEFSGEDMHGYGTLYDHKGQVIFEGQWKRGQRIDI